jgi:hypothetical protein
VVPSGGDLSSRLIFLVGARRSGTNWLHSLLGLHPRVAKVPSETHLFYTLARLQERFQHGLIGSANTGAVYLPRDEMIASFRDLCDRAFAIQMRTYGGPDHLLVERTPLHALHLDLIQEIYPEAPVVHLIRDGREVAVSLTRQSWGPPTLREAAAEWLDTVTAARSHRPARYYEMRHEALVADVVAAMTGLCGFLGLAVTDDVIASWREAAPHRVNATPGGSAPDQSGEVEAVAGDVLRELGYEAHPSAPRRRRRWPMKARGAQPDPQPPRPVLADQIQHVIDQTMAAIQQRDVTSLAALLSPAVQARLHDSGRTLSGSDGREAVAEALIAALGGDGRQVRGDSNFGRPAFTILLTHERPGGRVHRAVVVTVDDTLLVTRLELFTTVESPAAG